MNIVKFKSLHLENFKGFKMADVNFGDKTTTIIGSNGIGKTTIATGIMWILFGVDYDLVNNPKVRREVDRQPINDVPVVGELVLELNGKEIVARKVQKRSVKESSYADSNTYSINGVEKTMRDFNAYFDISMDDLKMCMNIEGFMSQNPKEMREFLFKLPENITEADIIQKFDEFAELRSLVENYSVEEISAMNKASITKLNKEIGEYPGRIDEVHRQIVEVDTDALEQRKSELNHQLEELSVQEEDSLSRKKELEAKSNDILELQFKKSDIERNASKKIIEDRSAAEKQLNEARQKYSQHENEYAMASMDVKRLEGNISRAQAEKSRLIDEYNRAKAEEFEAYVPLPEISEADKICPLCKRPLDANVVEERVKARDAEEHARRVAYDKRLAEWQKSKDSRIMNIADHGKDEVHKIDTFKAEREKAVSRMKEIEEKRQLAKKECERLEALLSQLPSAPDLSENQEYIALVDEIRKKEEALMQIDDGTEFRKEIQQKRRFIQSELDSVNAEFFKASKNTELEQRIEFLREEHMMKEQAKSDCQKILSLLDALDKKKNELLVDDINSHFGGRVTWDLFAFAKNGGYKKDYCEPCIDGYLVKDTANKGRRIEAKMIIALSIQKIVGIQCPIVLDDAESLDSWRLPVCDSQLIVLRREDNREMEVQTA